MNDLSQYPFEIRPLNQEEGGGYLISFLDFSECISDGETPDEAISNGMDALAETIAALDDMGLPVPEPGSGGSYSEQRLQETSQLWDGEAATFDEPADHGLNDPQTREAWTELLRTWLPAAASAVLDAGCGTGTLSVLLAGLGHRVTGIDISPAMLDLARAKADAQGYAVEFHLMDAAAPEFPPRLFDAVVCRHILWTLPEPARVLERWTSLLKPGGRLVLIEGWWSTGAGLHADEVMAALPATLGIVTVETLNNRPILWGREVSDERYMVVTEFTV